MQVRLTTFGASRVTSTTKSDLQADRSIAGRSELPNRVASLLHSKTVAATTLIFRLRTTGVFRHHPCLRSVGARLSNPDGGAVAETSQKSTVASLRLLLRRRPTRLHMTSWRSSEACRWRPTMQRWEMTALTGLRLSSLVSMAITTSRKRSFEMNRAHHIKRYFGISLLAGLHNFCYHAK